MQSLKFLGNGSGFTWSHTNAFFETVDEFVLIDISMINLKKLLDLKPYNKDTYVFITHMHDDHTSGLGLLCQWYFYVYKKKLTIVCPKELQKDLLWDLIEIKGVDKEIFNFVEASEFNKPWFVKSIKTTHAPEIEGKCFSYMFKVNEKVILYTGDTNTLEPYEGLKYDELYVDVSASYGGVHLKYNDCKDKLLEIAETSRVYLMHIDNIVDMLQLMGDTKLRVAMTI